MVDIKRRKNKEIEILTDILFDQCYEKVYKTVYIMTRNKELTEDAVQEGFYRAITKIDQLRDKSKFCSWATTIAINEAKKLILKNNQLRESQEIYYKSNLEGSSDPVYNEVSTRYEVESVLNKLSPSDREILILKYYLDYSIEEIAKALDISQDNAKVRLHRARQRYKAIDEGGYDDDVAGEVQHE